MTVKRTAPPRAKRCNRRRGAGGDEVIEESKAPAKLARSAGVSPAQVRPSKPPGSECCVRRRRRRTRSVHSGCVGCVIEHEMMNSRERRLCLWSNATCAMPSCEALPSRRGLRAHHAQKDRVGLRLNEHIEEEDGPLVFQHACKLGLEGIVSKHKDSPYNSGRSPHWIK